MSKSITTLWLEEFVVDGLCGLCGNYGFVGPFTTSSPAAKPITMSRRPCICPNGRAFARRRKRHAREESSRLQSGANRAKTGKHPGDAR